MKVKLDWKMNSLRKSQGNTYCFNFSSQCKTQFCAHWHMTDDNIFMPVVNVQQLCLLSLLHSVLNTDSYLFHPVIQTKSIRKKKKYPDEEYSAYTNTKSLWKWKFMFTDHGLPHPILILAQNTYSLSSCSYFLKISQLYLFFLVGPSSSGFLGIEVILIC